MNTHEGITQSATAQDCRSHGWGDRALAILRQYCAARKRRKFPGEFTIENFRDCRSTRAGCSREWECIRLRHAPGQSCGPDTVCGLSSCDYGERTWPHIA